MKRVLTAVVLIPLVLLLIFRGPSWLFVVVAGVFGVLALREYLNIAEISGYKPLHAPTYALLILLFVALTLSAAAWPDPGEIDLQNPLRPNPLLDVANLLEAFPGALAVFLLLALAMKLRDAREALPSAAVSLVGLTYIGLPLAIMVRMRLTDGPYFLLFLFGVVWVGDIAAYYTGRSIGRIKLAPAISPNKTWEGAVASVVAAVLLGLLLHRYSASILAFLSHNLGSTVHWTPVDHPLWLALLFAVLGNVAAQIGDLAESAMKRGAGIKDSGNILPGHGGVLDRIDALLFAAPVLSYYSLVIGFVR